MKITFIGTGDAFCVKGDHNSALLEFDNTNLLIDIPATNNKVLNLQMNRGLESIDNVIITHLHEDHYNGVQQLIHFNNIVAKRKPNIFMHESLIAEFVASVMPGLRHSYTGEKVISDYVNLFPIREEFKISNITLKLVRTEHMPGMDTFGILCEPYFYYSADSNVDIRLLDDIWDRVEYIFHDCHMWDLYIASHASVDDIQNLSPLIKDKIYLMHYRDHYLDSDMACAFELKENLKLARPLYPYVMTGGI